MTIINQTNHEEHMWKENYKKQMKTEISSIFSIHLTTFDIPKVKVTH